MRNPSMRWPFMSLRAVRRYLYQERERCILEIENALKEENPHKLQEWFYTLETVNNRIKQCARP